MLSEREKTKLLVLYISECKLSTAEAIKNYAFDFDNTHYLHSNLTLQCALRILNLDEEVNKIDWLFNAIELKGRDLRIKTHPLRVNQFLNRLQKYPAEKIFKKTFWKGLTKRL